MNYKERRQLIYELVQKNKVETQEQLLGLLKDQGISATQATISRDIHALHITKVPGQDGRSYYAKAPAAVVDKEFQLRQAVAERVATVSCVQFMVVIKTSMKLTYAPVLAGMIDDLEDESIVGTLAGTDTLLAVCKDETSAQKFAQSLQAVLTGRV
ncbi:arginine repressor [uncultured Lactobacillus sp.]|uniref:arginine repressor n=1 Tax=uncultured Lactobacillus sp. TaxID=153152 RepID=UPI002665FB72|nr:arginine repressor [uncultured Lactobacillus sp.]